MSLNIQHPILRGVCYWITAPDSSGGLETLLLIPITRHHIPRRRPHAPLHLHLSRNRLLQSSQLRETLIHILRMNPQCPAAIFSSGGSPHSPPPIYPGKYHHLPKKPSQQKSPPPPPAISLLCSPICT